ncbi:MAG: UDP-glucose 4-epimerase [Methanomicrobiales archaeon HGW-Methanomicrobiales-3]|jgi:UDP-glucose 4-epimerase|nr:MAG: UDP-glucose 4-epimerase [Methanomicrobiales archaeon HGW-Methanomicrobiales-3]
MFDVVTGGAGFIGSHLVDALVTQGDEVLVIDSFCGGRKENIARHLESGRARLVQCDLLDDGWQASLKGADRVYHLAADPDVRQSAMTPDPTFRNNIVATYRVLEAMRAGNVPELVFTSTSTVYGNAAVIPTPENYSPLEPVSVYGASKLACEALISSYCHSFGMRSWQFRFANIIGARSGHGVITDFVRKLRENAGELEILGDGKQTKSYLEISECIAAMQFAISHSREPVNTYNIGSEDWIDVKTIADVVAEEMRLPAVQYRFTGGALGWVGDVPKMQLSIERLKALGWKPQKGSRESVRMAVQAAVRGV